MGQPGQLLERTHDEGRGLCRCERIEAEEATKPCLGIHSLWRGLLGRHERGVSEEPGAVDYGGRRWFRGTGRWTL